jgi:hypothetical protein
MDASSRPNLEHSHHWIALLVAVTHLIVPDTEATDYPPIENLLPVVLFSSVLGLALGRNRRSPQRGLVSGAPWAVLDNPRKVLPL